MRRFPRTRTLVLSGLLMGTLATLPGCVRVHAWDRGKLASWAMVDPFGDTELAAQYRSKVVESKTAGGLPGTAPGGGCGCTQ
jgi:hypothetical protein